MDRCNSLAIAAFTAPTASGDRISNEKRKSRDNSANAGCDPDDRVQALSLLPPRSSEKFVSCPSSAA